MIGGEGTSINEEVVFGFLNEGKYNEAVMWFYQEFR